MVDFSGGDCGGGDGWLFIKICDAYLQKKPKRWSWELQTYQSYLSAQESYGTDNLKSHLGPIKGQPGHQAQSAWVYK